MTQAHFLDRYAARIIEVVIAALLLWVGIELLNLRDASARAQERTAAIAEGVSELKRDVAELRMASTNHLMQDKHEFNALDARVLRLETARK
jgi:cell division protein FtsB